MSSAWYEFYHHHLDTPFRYEDLLARQSRLVNEMLLKKDQGKLLIAEVAPVITLGKRDSNCDLLKPFPEYEKQGIVILKTDRGGLTTYHGKGQWVIFPTQELQVFAGPSRGVRKTIKRLLTLLKECCQPFCSEPLEIRTDSQTTGIWKNGQKLCSVGVRIRSGILCHGFCLNLYPTPQSFYGIRPCGQDVAPGYVFQNETDARLAQEPLFQRLLLAFEPYFQEKEPRTALIDRQAVAEL